MTASLSLHYYYAQWSLGTVLLAFSPDGLCAALPGDDRQALLADLQKRHQRAPLSAVTTDNDGQVAALLGKPAATRAVASACAANPIAVLIPCHRVLRADGGLGGFRWGLELKRALLQRESAVTGAT